MFTFPLNVKMDFDTVIESPLSAPLTQLPAMPVLMSTHYFLYSSRVTEGAEPVPDDIGSGVDPDKSNLWMVGGSCRTKGSMHAPHRKQGLNPPKIDFFQPWWVFYKRMRKGVTTRSGLSMGLTEDDPDLKQS